MGVVRKVQENAFIPIWVSENDENGEQTLINSFYKILLLIIYSNINKRLKEESSQILFNSIKRTFSRTYKIILTKGFYMIFQKIANNDPAIIMICEPRWKILAAPMTIINEMYLDTRSNITKLQDRTLDMLKRRSSLHHDWS